MAVPEQTQTLTPNRAQTLLRLLVLIFTALFVALVYTFLHEGGHALFGLLFGGRLTDFNINFVDFTAHVGMEGEFPTLQRAIISAAGISLPLILWAIWMARAPRRGSPVVEWLKIISSAGFVNTLLAWIILPWLYQGGSAPGDDSVTFLAVTGLLPALVSGAALLVYLAAAALALNKLEGFRGLARRLRDNPGDLKDTATLRTLRGMAVTAVVILLVVGGLDLLQGPGGGIRVPKDYTQVAQVPLSGRSLDRQPVYQFTLEESAQVSLFFHLEQIDEGPLLIEMTGPGEFHPEFARFTGPEVGIGDASVHPQDLMLEPGAYQVLLTAASNPGQVTLSVKVIPVP